MTGENTTGPLTLGRWQQPAALILAGRVTPDPYPLEVILFCAACGQQFFGAHVTTGSARVPDRSHQPVGYRVTGGVHVTGDTRAAGGIHVAGGIDQPGGNHQAGARVYRTSCDCRPGPLPAGEVELQVYAETHVHAFGTDTVTGLTSVHYAVLAVRIFSRIEVGPTVDDINFAARI